MGIAERKEREFRRREGEILDAAVRLLEREDWQLVTIERIAQEAEIGKGTVYLHFPSKEAIYGRLAHEFAGGVLAELRGIDAAQAPVERLRDAIRIFFAAHLHGRTHHRVAEYCSQDDIRRRLDETTRSELERVEAEIIGIIHGILADGIRAGAFADRPLDVLMISAHATLAGAVRLLGGPCAAQAGDGATEAQLVEEITRFILAGLMYFDRVPFAGEAAGRVVTNLEER